MNTTVDTLIAPHGGALVNREIKAEARRNAVAAAARLPRVPLNAVQYSDVCCIATGVFSPLTGFVGRADYESILDRMRLTNGTVWSIPVTRRFRREHRSRSRILRAASWRRWT
jgi:sulfate adenylyltransferase